MADKSKRKQQKTINSFFSKSRRLSGEVSDSPAPSPSLPDDSLVNVSLDETDRVVDPVPLEVENFVNNNVGDKSDESDNEQDEFLHERDEFLDQPVGETERESETLEEGSRDKIKKKEGLDADTEGNIGKGSKNKSVSNDDVTKSRNESGLRPRQPKLWKFPINKDINTKKTRSFVKSWYDKYPWLEYSVETDSAFCFTCLNFPTPGDQTETPFTEKGFRNWAKAMDTSKGFAKHEKSEQHKNSYLKWINYKKILEGKTTAIESQICPGRDEILKNNREYFRHLFKYALWFSVNEVPSRGHDESEDSTNPGKWLTFISMQLETNPTFKDLQVKLLQNSHHSVNYCSKTSFNGFIEVIASAVRDEICNEISESKIFSVLIDESKDMGKREELALVIRYFKEKVVERFFSMKMLTDFDAEAIKDVTKKNIDDISQKSDGSNIASIGADGASVMSGQFGGVAELLRSEHFPWLIYVHCTAHRLNLMVNDLMKDSPLSTDVIQTVNSLNSFLNVPKVRQVYEDEHRDMFPRQEVKHLTQQIEIRWGCKFEAIDLLAEKLPLFLSTMVKVSTNANKTHDPKHVEQASGFYHKLVSGKFIVCLASLRLYLGEMYYLSKELQHENINWTDVKFEIQRTRSSIGKISPEKVLNEANNLSDKIHVPLTMNLSIHYTRSSRVPEEAENIISMIEDLNEYMQEKIRDEFDVRFDSKNIEILKSFTALDSGNDEYLNYNVLEYVLDHFTFLDINRSILKIELERVKLDLNIGLPISKGRCENLMKLISLKNMVATSTASVERVFSGMNRTCSKLRAKLTPERLGDYLCISMNRDIAEQLDVDSLINSWSKKISRKVAV